MSAFLFCSKIVVILLLRGRIASEARKPSVSFESITPEFSVFAIVLVSWFPFDRSPASFSREAFIQQREHFCHIELDILQIQIFLALFLHFEQIVELQIQF